MDAPSRSGLASSPLIDSALRVEDEEGGAGQAGQANELVARPKPKPGRSDPAVQTPSNTTSPTLTADAPTATSSITGWNGNAPASATRPRTSDGATTAQRPAKRQRQHSQSGQTSDGARLSLSPNRGYAMALETHVRANGAGGEANGGGSGSGSGGEAMDVSEDAASPAEGGESDGDVEIEGEGEGEAGESDGDEDGSDSEGDDEAADGDDAEGEGDSDDDDDDESDDDDGDDDTGSVDLAGSPIFISSTRPLGISDLVDGPVQVKQEAGDGDVEMSGGETIGLGLDTGGAAGHAETSAAATSTGEGGAAGQAAPATEGDAPPNVLVAKKKPRKKLVVPSTPPPFVPKPLLTIRLDIDLGGQSKTQLVNFKDTAREKNVVPADYFDEVLPPKSPGAMDEDEDEGGRAGPPAATGPANGLPPPLFGGGGLGDADEEEMKRIAAELEKKYDDAGKKKKKKIVKDRYDTHDPFIDDSELKFDEPTYYIRPKKDGYYVQSGPVELMEQTPQKPKVRRAAPAGQPTTAPASIGNGVIKKRKQPIGMGYRAGLSTMSKKSTDGSRTASTTNGRTTTTGYDSSSRVANGTTSPTKPQRALSNGANHAEPIDVEAYEPAKPVPPPLPTTKEALWPLFSQEVRDHLDAIAGQRHLVDETQKKNFPQQLKPMVKAAGQSAIDTNCFGEDYFRALTIVLPYNKFTMKKQQLTMTHDHHLARFQQREDELLRDFAAEVNRTKDDQVRDHDFAMQEYREAVQKAQEAPSTTSWATQPAASGEDGAAAPVDPAAAAGPEPTAKFKFSPEMRAIFWDLIKLQDSKTMLMNEYRATVKPVEGDKPISELSNRTALYKRMVVLFPTGFMQTTFLSREMSQLKKKHETTAMRANTTLTEGLNENGLIGQLV